MLRQLRDAIAAEEGRPIRVEVLARRLDIEPPAAAAMLDHARRRGLLPATWSCASDPCSAVGHGCRRCPLGPAAESQRA